MSLVLARLLDNPFSNQDEIPVIAPSVDLGGRLAHFEGVTIEGLAWSDAELEGSPALVFHFRDQLPEEFVRYAQLLHQQLLHQRFEELRIVGITRDADAMLEHRKTINHPSFPVLADAEGLLAKKLGFQGTFGLYVTDREGRVRFRRLGLLDREDLRQLVEKAVRGKIDYEVFVPQTSFRGTLAALPVLDLESGKQLPFEALKPRRLVFVTSSFKPCNLTLLLGALEKHGLGSQDVTLLFSRGFASSDRSLAHEMEVRQLSGSAYRALETVSPFESAHYPLLSDFDQVLALEFNPSGEVTKVQQVRRFFADLSESEG